VERWPGLPWNTGPASRGMVARHAVESAVVPMEPQGSGAWEQTQIARSLTGELRP